MPHVARVAQPCLRSSKPAPLQSLFLQGADTASFGLSQVHNGCKLFAMRHGKKLARLGRPADQRKALVRNLTTEVLRHGKIRTTAVKAKAIRKYVDKMIGLAKRGDLHARRQALAFVFDKDLVRRMFEKVPDTYADRTSGYCRVLKEQKVRRGDAAVMATIELL
ncbi:hypothetical protein WJX73_005522 [Symbiochloris irregularis]|uniref:50S ribosomal protein L17 n=1 Tax=Symbiochloris irregularis TaxID=706552 RepID=A0AAW1NWH4_9CHLO